MQYIVERLIAKPGIISQLRERLDAVTAEKERLAVEKEQLANDKDRLITENVVLTTALAELGLENAALQQAELYALQAAAAASKGD